MHVWLSLGMFEIQKWSIFAQNLDVWKFIGLYEIFYGFKVQIRPVILNLSFMVHHLHQEKV